MDVYVNDCMHLTTLVKYICKKNNERIAYNYREGNNIFVYAPIRIPFLKGA